MKVITPQPSLLLSGSTSMNSLSVTSMNRLDTLWVQYTVSIDTHTHTHTHTHVTHTHHTHTSHTHTHTHTYTHVTRHTHTSHAHTHSHTHTHTQTTIIPYFSPLITSQFTRSQLATVGENNGQMTQITATQLKYLAAPQRVTGRVCTKQRLAMQLLKPS